jgi:hypothetical protein
MRFHGLLNHAYANTRARNLACWRYVLQEEMVAGTRFMRQGASVYVYLGMTQEILSMSARNDRVTAYLNQVYGLTQTDPIGKFVFSTMRDYAISHAVKAELRRFVAFNVETKTAYMSTYDGQMWKIDGGTPTRVPNGEDDVFFIDDDGGTTVEVDIAPHGILLDKLTNINFAEVGIGGMVPEQQRMALTTWLFMLAFPDLMPTKPLLILEGTQGSGKSAAVQLLQLALLGASKPMILSKNKEDDFGVLLLRSPIAVFDNTDSFIEWVPDAICAYTTLGYWVKRKLYSDDDEAKIKPHAFIAVASKNPASFRREDVADRCIILRLERRAEFARFQKLQQDVLDLRPQLLGEYIWYVNQLVHRMRVYADEEHMEVTRMADFAAFARVIGDQLHWTKEDVVNLMDALASERDAFINEEDPLVDLLNRWIVYRGGGFSNIGRERTLHELHSELEDFAQANKLPYYKSSRTLAQKLRSPHIDRDFDVEITVVNARKIYRIWRKHDLRLAGASTPGLPAPREPSFNEDGEIILFR